MPIHDFLFQRAHLLPSMSQPQRKRTSGLTLAVTHIPLSHVNASKLAALDALWEVYRVLCQEYVTYFCTEVAPDPHLDFVFGSELSARWQRVAVQQAAGIAQSWRTNHAAAQADYAERLAYYESLSTAQQATRKAPLWNEWDLPILKAVCIQANVNVAMRVMDDYAALALTPADKGQFDFWIRLSTLDKGLPVYLPIKLAAYHRKVLAGLKPNSSLTLNRRQGKWSLTLTVDVPVPDTEAEGQPLGTAGGDVGIRNFFVDNRGNRFGGVDDDFAQQVKRSQEKTSRKAKLRACLKKNGVTTLPSTSSVVSQRMGRRLRQDINRAINQALDEHPNDVIAIEALSVGSMRFRARRMNAYLKASNLAHVLKQLKWKAALRGIPLVSVNAAYSSQECPHCHFADRANRPTQQTFCCQVCGYADHADVVAAGNLERRLVDRQIKLRQGKETVKRLLDQRHADWRVQTGYS